MSKIYTKLNIDNTVATAGSKCFKRLSTEEPAEELGNYIRFSSPNSFTLATDEAKKGWDGTLEYSTDTTTWNEWGGTTTLSADSGKLYLRGIGNTYVKGVNNSFVDRQFVLSGTNIACEGNIENLLDYATVVNGKHPAMAENCFSHLFYGCTSLIKAPELPANTLVSKCYDSMFHGCTSLTTAPALPATTLAEYCYSGMFYDCTSLATAPALPAITLADFCYYRMFGNCRSLTTAPGLPAIISTYHCYSDMFNGCTSLTTAPALPATTLAEYCYSRMFYGCTSLTTAPALPVTTLAEYCYYGMFNGCTSLTAAPALPATTLAEYCYWYMFYGCTSLTTASELPATTLAEKCYYYMFYGCTNLTTLPELPAATLAVSCYHYMFEGCTSLKLSTTQTGEYQTPYRIPTSGTGTTATNALADMFTSTGGTFTGTPEINTTYYTSNTVIGVTQKVIPAGTYTFNEVLTVPTWTEQAMNFSIEGGAVYSSMKYNNDKLLYQTVNDGTTYGLPMFNYSTNSWEIPAGRQVTLPEDVTASVDYAAWFTSNTI